MEVNLADGIVPRSPAVVRTGDAATYGAVTIGAERMADADAPATKAKMARMNFIFENLVLKVC